MGSVSPRILIWSYSVPSTRIFRDLSSWMLISSFYYCFVGFYSPFISLSSFFNEITFSLVKSWLTVKLSSRSLVRFVRYVIVFEFGFSVYLDFIRNVIVFINHFCNTFFMCVKQLRYFLKLVSKLVRHYFLDLLNCAIIYFYRICRSAFNFLTHFSPVLHFYSLWKRQKTRCSDVFRGYRNVTLD